MVPKQLGCGRGFEGISLLSSLSLSRVWVGTQSISQFTSLILVTSTFQIIKIIPILRTEAQPFSSFLSPGSVLFCLWPLHLPQSSSLSPKLCPLSPHAFDRALEECRT